MPIAPSNPNGPLKNRKLIKYEDPRHASFRKCHRMINHVKSCLRPKKVLAQKTDENQDKIHILFNRKQSNFLTGIPGGPRLPLFPFLPGFPFKKNNMTDGTIVED